jgi:hypothetical protein
LRKRFCLDSRALEQAQQQSKTEPSAGQTAIEMALRDLDAKLKRWEETREGGLLSLEDCAARIKELRLQREALLKRKVELQKKARAGARILPIPTRLMDEYVRQIQMRLAKKIGYKTEFLREILKEVRVKGNAVRLTYKLPMTVRTPPSEGENPRTGSSLHCIKWWSRWESNPRPLECDSSALPTELRPHSQRVAALRYSSTLSFRSALFNA